jgi:hypothetical protein
VYLDKQLETLVTQPYEVDGSPTITLWRPLAAASETVLVTVLIEGEPAARQQVVLPLWPIESTAVDVATAGGAIIGGASVIPVIDGGTI